MNHLFYIIHQRSQKHQGLLILRSVNQVDLESDKDSGFKANIQSRIRR